MEKEYKVLVGAFMVKYADNKMPMRTMVGTKIKETAKAVQMKLRGVPEPSATCLHCNRKLTHPVSVLYGIGPVCGQHFHINPLNSEEELQEKMEEIKSKMAAVTWEGWIPKSQIKEITEVEGQPIENDEEVEEPEVRFRVQFKYDGKIYNTTTNSEKLYKIRKNAEILELEQVI